MANGKAVLPFEQLQPGIKIELPKDTCLFSANSSPKPSDGVATAMSHFVKIIPVRKKGFRFATEEDKRITTRYPSGAVNGIVAFVNPSWVGKQVKVDWVHADQKTGFKKRTVAFALVPEPTD